MANLLNWSNQGQYVLLCKRFKDVVSIFFYVRSFVQNAVI